MSKGIAADQLRLFIERIEALEEEKRRIADDIKGVYAEAKSNGYDVKTMRSIVRLRRMDPDDRREYEALLDLYKGALGMLDGTPLGKWAQDRTQRKGQDDKDAPPEPGSSDGANAGGIGGPDASQPAVTPEEARQQGGRAARAGQPVTSNPFPARDANRAAWDEGWCAAAGSDGMDIPEFLRPPTKKPKPPTDDADDAKDAA